MRNLRKNKVYSFLNIFGLSIGIACAGLIFLWVENEITYDEVHTKKNVLYAVHVNIDQGMDVFTIGSTPRVMAPALNAEIPGIANTARVSDGNQRLLFTLDDKSLYAAGRYADASLFDMFTLPFVQGNAADAFSHLHSIVVTEKTAKLFFGQHGNIIGKSVRISNEQDYLITGVIKDPPDNSSLQFDWLIPFENDPYYSQSLDWDSYGPLTYVELETNADTAAIGSQLTDFIHRHDASQQCSAFLFPMSRWHLYREFENGKPTGSGQIRQVNRMVLLGWTILVIACINFMNLATANSQRRTKEVGVRKTLGAARKGLIMQFLGEALLLSFFAMILAVIFVATALPAFNALMQTHLTLHITSPIHLTALVAIALLCGLMAGSYPAFHLSAFHPTAVLNGLKVNMRTSLLRKVLVVFQFTVSIIFIISTLVIHLQIQHARQRNLGFNKDDLIEVNMQRSITAVFPVIKEELLQTGLVDHAATADHVILNGGNIDDRFRWEGQPEDALVSIAFRDVSPEFVATSGMKIIEGRDFRTAEHGNILITRSLARLMGNESPLGKTIASPRGNEDGVYSNMTVVGVVDDYVYGNVFGRPSPVIFFCQQFGRDNLLYVRVKPGRRMEALAKIGTITKKYNPDYPFEYRFVDTQFNDLFTAEVSVGRASGIFASLAIIISSLGLFGLATHMAEQRKKELSIRKVLGATVAGIIRLISADFMKLVLVSCLVAFPLAWWAMNDWLDNYEYRITLKLWIFAVAGGTALSIAFATIGYHALRAATRNPVDSIRNE
ncbi:ABC transporter permease [Parapedobacter sp. DT-150]|uniref:ABC transporter permease n=1 Tax=Parapedobacter sp. DT-150 TaxID=3396162 RepID=UPI003F199FD7